MIKPVVLYGNKILRQRAEPIQQGSNVKSIVKNLWDTMYNADGAGLAGPQIGKSLRIFVIDLPDQEWKGVFINPTIEEKCGDMLTFTEGCLSLPSIEAPIIRENEIEITYFDENWRFHAEKYKGLKSRVIQHEYDHLDGMLWVDRIDPAIRMKFVGRLKAIQDREVETGYPSI